jgi:autotransporter-associated beta strand protein
MHSHLLRTLSILVFLGSLADAAELTWTGGGGAGSTSWSLPINWGGATPAAGDTLVFPGVAQRNANNDLGAGTVFGPLTINAGGYVLTGSTVTLNGGIFLNGANTAQVALPLALGAPQAFTVSDANGNLELSQALSGAGGVIKSGPGTLILTSNEGYSGPTIVAGGPLEADATLPTVVQLASGYVTGTGTVPGITSLNQGAAGISPGTNSAAGTLTSTGDVKLYAGDNIHFNITSSAVDQLAVTGAVDLGKALITVALQTGFFPLLNQEMVLIANDGTDPIVFDAADPSNYLAPITINGLKFSLCLVGGTNQNDLVLKRVPNATAGFATFTTSAPTSAAPGATVTFSALLTGVVLGGQVSLWDGNVRLGTPQTMTSSSVTFTTSTLTPGVHRITAMYEGNGSSAPARSPIITQTITGNATTTVLTVAPATTSTPGATVTLTATVTDTTAGTAPAGTVDFYDSGTVIGTSTVAAGSAIITTSTLLSGSHSFGAIYHPTGVYLDSFATPVAHTVTDGVTPATTTTLASSAPSAVAGSDLTFTATVSTATSGQVRFLDGAATLGTATLSGGTATFTTAGLAAGSHTITASYLGTIDFTPSTSPGLAQTVTPAPGGGSSGGGGSSSDSGGGCGLGSGVSALALGLLLMLGLRLRRA